MLKILLQKSMKLRAVRSYVTPSTVVATCRSFRRAQFPPYLGLETEVAEFSELLTTSKHSTQCHTTG